MDGTRGDNCPSFVVWLNSDRVLQHNKEGDVWIIIDNAVYVSCCVPITIAQRSRVQSVAWFVLRFSIEP